MLAPSVATNLISQIIMELRQLLYRLSNCQRSAGVTSRVIDPAVSKLLLVHSHNTDREGSGSLHCAVQHCALPCDGLPQQTVFSVKYARKCMFYILVR